MPAITRTSVRWVNNRFIATCLEGYISFSTDQVNWTNINIGVTSNLRSVAYGLGYYIIVGDGGRISRSTNGTTWTHTTSGTSNYTHVEFDAGRFVAVGDSGRLVSSTTGTTWTAYTSGTAVRLNSVRYVNSLWCAVGNDGILCTSTNGTAWTAQAVDSRPLYGIAYLAGATTWKYNAGKKASADGVTWTSFYGNNSTADTFQKSVYVGGATPYLYFQLVAAQTDRFHGYIAAHPTQNRFYRAGRGARGFGGSQRAAGDYFLTGYDLCALDHSVSAGTSTTNSWSGFQQTSQDFYGMNNAPETHFEELNGDLWIGRYMFFTPDGGFVQTSTGSFGYLLSSAAAGTLFQFASVGISLSERPVAAVLAAYGNGYYVMLGGNAGLVNNFVPYRGQHHVLRGTTITGVTPLVTYAYGHVKFPIDLGNLGAISETVSPRNPPDLTYPLLEAGMTFGAGRFVAVGPRPINNTNCNYTTVSQSAKQFVVIYSTDNGASWSDVTFPQSNGYDISGRVAGSANEIVATCRWYNNGTPGWVMRSTDAVNWSYYYTGYDSRVNEIKYLNGYFYTVHDNGGIARSLDGITWTTLVALSPATALTGQAIFDIAYIAGRYVLCTNTGLYQTSTDLSVFTTYTSGGPQNFIFNDGSRLISSAFDSGSGTWRVRTSTDGINWTQQAVEEAADIAFSGTKYIAVRNGEAAPFRESTNLTTWTDINLSNLTGVGIIIRDSLNQVKLQSYDSTALNYLCTRIIQQDYVAGTDQTIYVTGADGYKIFVVVTPDSGAAGGQRLPYVTLRRGASPTFQPYYTVTYPAYGGSGSTVNPANVWCTVFTTGEVEKITY